MDKKEFFEEIKGFIGRVRADISLKEVFLFGSRATGKATKDSDIDLLIVSDYFKGMSPFKRGAKMYDYWTLRIPVDFLCFTVDEFNLLKKRISIVHAAIQEGISFTS